MALTRVEKERVVDSRLKIQSIAESLQHIDPKKIPQIDEINNCLEAAEYSLSSALRSDT